MPIVQTSESFPVSESVVCFFVLDHFYVGILVNCQFIEIETIRKNTAKTRTFILDAILLFGILVLGEILLDFMYDI